MSRWAAGIGIFALAAYASGCSWTHRCAVPTPVVEAAPGPRLPIAVEVRYAPPAVPAEVTRANAYAVGFGPEHRMVVSAVPPTRALFDRLAASMFERTVSAPPADAVLEIRLDRFDVGTTLNGAFSDVAYHATVSTADGAEVATFAVEGASAVAASLRHLGFCGARGEAVAVAMQQAGETLVQKVSESDALAAWLAARGIAPVRFTVKPFEAYAERTSSTSATPSPTTSAFASEPPRAVPVRAGPPPAPLAPRSFRLRGGLAQFRPESTAGKLEDPSKGLALTVFGGEFRLTSVLRTDIDLEISTRDYSAKYVPHYTGFGPRTTLDSTSVGVGLRVSPPLGGRPRVEPWLGASARIIHTRLEVTYFGGLAYSEAHEAFGVGADVGGGVSFFLGARWMLGLDARWRFARANLAPLGSVGIGGLLIGGSFGAVLPP